MVDAQEQHGCYQSAGSMTYTLGIDAGLQPEYSKCVLEKKRTGFGDSNYQRRTAAIKRFFYVRTALVRLQWRALVGIPSGMPVAVGTGSPTPSCARLPHLAMSSGSSTTNGGHIA